VTALIHTPEQHHELLEAAWEASARHLAVTPRMLTIFLLDSINQHPSFVTLNLLPLKYWLGTIRDMQPEGGGKLAVGRAEVNHLLDRLLDAFAATVSPNPIPEMGFVRPNRIPARPTTAVRLHGQYPKKEINNELPGR
jgi:hypothetical protein